MLCKMLFVRWLKGVVVAKVVNVGIVEIEGKEIKK